MRSPIQRPDPDAGRLRVRRRGSVLQESHASQLRAARRFRLGSVQKWKVIGPRKLRSLRRGPVRRLLPAPAEPVGAVPDFQEYPWFRELPNMQAVESIVYVVDYFY